jgi:hypothetical protein
LEHFVVTVRRSAPGALLCTALAVATAACGASGSTASPGRAGKYLEDTAGTGLGSLATMCSLKSMLGSTSGSAADDAGTTKAGTATIDGQRAVKLVNAKQHGTAYVTDTTKPEVLQIAVGGSGGGSLSFSYSTTPPAITPPPASQTIDGSKYGF